MTYGDQWAGESVEQPVADGLWPAGNYEGTLLRHECGASASKGTNYIRLWFDVNGQEKAVDVWITEAAAQMATDRLAKVGWDGEYPDCGFNMAEPVKLYMKHEVYKGKTKERWDISTFEAKPADDNVMSRFAARFKSVQAKPAAIPAAPPKAPPKSAAPPRPAAPARPATAPPRPAATAEVHTQDTAWAAWAEELGDKCDADSFWRAVDGVRGSREVEAMTSDDWSKVIAACPPF